MTLALLGYSGIFMRYAFAVTPRNYLLFGCHFVNFGAQSTQAYRYVNYWYMGGNEKKLEQGLGNAEGKAEDMAQKAGGAVKDAAAQVQQSAKGVVDQAKAQVERVTR